MPRKKASPNAKTAASKPKAEAAKAKAQPAAPIADRRPSVPNAVSKAYGAPGHANMPRKQEPKTEIPMITVMKNMVEQDITSESEEVQDDDISEEDYDLQESRQARTRITQRNRTATRTPEPRLQDEEESEDEVEEYYIDEKGNKPFPKEQESLPSLSKTNSPFAAVARKIRSIWRSPERNIQTNFMTEDKIASEARIARPHKGVARRLIEMKQKVINAWSEYTDSRFVRTLLVAIKYFIAALVVLLLFQATYSALPEEMSIPETLSRLGERIASPVQALVDKISIATSHHPIPNTPELDLSQLKSLKDSTTAQFKHLKHRLDNIEASYNQLAKKAKTPSIPVRKINLFATGSGLTIDPYLTSPTRARDLAKGNLVVKWFSRWRGWPESVHHGPMAAFTPWEDMGDCWCTPDSGGSAQIAVKLAQPVVPKELVVEHVSKHTTLQAGSAPKNIELWAQIRDSKRREAIVKGALQYGIHQNSLHKQDDQLRSLDETWIRIGQWMYNIDGTNHIQTFEIQLPLEDFETPVDRLAFRASDNWGPVKYVCLYRLKLHGLVANSKSEKLNLIGY